MSELSKNNTANDYKDCTVLICSCDAYSDLWDPFFRLFKAYWPDCPYRIVLNTECGKYEIEGLQIECLQLYKKGSNVPYGKRMLKHIDHIETPFVLVILEDFFFLDRVKTDAVRRVITYLKNNTKIAMFKLSPNLDPMNTKDDRYPEYEKRPRYGHYRHSLQIAIWRTEYFKKTWRVNESPWDWEVWGTYRSINDGWDYYCLKENASPPIDYDYNFYRGGSLNVYRGKWTHGKYEEIFKKNGIIVDFEKRGWYSNEQMVGIDDSFIVKEKRKLHSAGMKMYIRIMWWRIRKYIKWRKGQPINATYMDYLRGEHKEVIKIIKF